jgi:hypothetical protein
LDCVAGVCIVCVDDFEVAVRKHLPQRHRDTEKTHTLSFLARNTSMVK